MKILILANDRVGLYNFRKELIEKLRQSGNEVVLAYPCFDTDTDEKVFQCKIINTEVDRRGKDLLKDFKLYNQYKKILSTIKPDLVITYTIKPNIYGSLACKKFKCPYAVNITGLGSAFTKNNLFKKVVSFLYKKALKSAKVVFFENEGNREVFLENKITEKDKTVVLRGAGVNVEEYNYYPIKDDQTIKFLFIGRIMKDKGINEFLNAAERIKQKYNNTQFDVIGNMEENYSNIIMQSVENNIINYHGFQRDVKEFIKNCHCLILPSYHEGMSNALLECAAMGRPLITSNINGCKEAVDEGYSGYLLNVCDCDDLFMKIEKFINLDYSEKLAMGINSRNKMLKQFDRKEVIEKTLVHLFNE